MNSRFFTTIMSLLVLSAIVFPSPMNADRTVIDLSGYDWGLVRDREATWVDDAIFLPPVDIAKLPVNPPTFGWDGLGSRIEKTVHLPATVEEYFWGDNGNAEGIAGDYRGVSWWVTTVAVGQNIAGKRVFLDFESVHLRAEVFVNRKLAGYDVIGHTPFSVDITDAIRPGETNEIAVRITDPLGNFSWNDRAVLKWGAHDVPACHGFGGITGRVFLRAVDPVFIVDVYVQNRPSITDVDVIATIRNTAGKVVPGTLTVTIYPCKEPQAVLWKKSFKPRTDGTTNEIKAFVKAPQAKIWDIDNPNLYIAEVCFESDKGSISDSMSRRFGFRWFDIGEKNGDRRFYLNGKRIVLRSGMSWGFWPVNGEFPTREMAERDVRLAKEFGLNLMNFHRSIGQPLVMEVADELGFLCYEEPGGYSCENAGESDSIWRTWRREKLLRMVRRDRSHPSLIIFNLQNRTPNELEHEDIANMRMVHEQDPSRIFTFTSGFWKEPPKDHPTKLFFKPYDFTEYYTGWYDMHLFSPSQSYADEFYNNPRDFARYTGDTGEIIFRGEDGAINNPPRLQLIKEYHERGGVPPGWIGRFFIDWYEAYDAFLDRSGFRTFFPDVDALTASIGNVSLYYHGRIMENIRMGNVTDCYTINGWAANHLTNHCDIADLYRNPVGNPAILARYCRPLYIAVKVRDKVAPSGSTVIADFFIVNEAGLKGKHTLGVTFENERGVKLVEKSYPVDITGGEEYGQLLVEHVELPLDSSHGYFTVRAVLSDREGKKTAEGSDKVFAVALPDIDRTLSGAIADTSGVINRMLEKTWGLTFPSFSETTGNPGVIIIGAPGVKRVQDVAAVMECVADGATAVVLDGADRFAGFISESSQQYYAADYRGLYPLSRGNLIAGKHELLDGLPQAQAFNWEYQVFNYPRGQGTYALKLYNGETVVAAVSDNQKDVGAALTVVPFGRGRVILSTLNLLSLLDAETPQSVVAKRVFGNMLMYAARRR